MYTKCKISFDRREKKTTRKKKFTCNGHDDEVVATEKLCTMDNKCN